MDPGSSSFALQPTDRGSSESQAILRLEPEVTLREIRTQDEYRACVSLQREVWGAGFTEIIPSVILMLGQKLGGVTAGAFDREGQLLGFVFGLTGLRDGRVVHWSDRLAVRPELRGLGVGVKLKAYQRQLLLDRGIDTVYWTFDPLVARNAHLNLNRLAVEVVEYVRDMYGSDTGSDVHSGLGTDRFLVVWHLGDERVSRTLAGELQSDEDRFAAAPVVNSRLAEGGIPVPFHGPRYEAEALRVEIPPEIEAVKARNRVLASEWRATTRAAFLDCLPAGYRVRAFLRDPATGRCFYGLVKEG